MYLLCQLLTYLALTMLFYTLIWIVLFLYISAGLTSRVQVNQPTYGVFKSINQPTGLTSLCISQSSNLQAWHWCVKVNHSTYMLEIGLYHQLQIVGWTSRVQVNQPSTPFVPCVFSLSLIISEIRRH